jgi:hypothetical protein
VLTKAIYRRVPVLIREGTQPENSWGISFLRMFDMAGDSGLFRTANDLRAEGWELEGNVYRKGNAVCLPLYEAKLLHQFDHRWATFDGADSRDVSIEEKSDPTRLVVPRYWVPEGEVRERLKDRWDRQWLLGWRDVTRNTDRRTMIATVLPAFGVGDKFLLMLPERNPAETASLLGSFGSFVFDYCTRQKLGGTALKYFVIKQLPALPPPAFSQRVPWASGPLSSWLQERVLELTYTAHDLKPFAEDCGFTEEPFHWDEERRFQLRCELDAAYFHLYLGTGAWHLAEGEPVADFTRLKAAFPTPRNAVEYVLDTFALVRKSDEERHGHYRTKQRILEVYDQLSRDTATAAATPLTAPQVNILKAMLYVMAFLRKANRRVRRDILEAGLVLMIDDDLREAFLSGRPVSGRKPGRSSPSLLRWLPTALDQLARTNRIEQDLHEEMPFIKLGAAAGDATGDREYHEKAARAIEVISGLGEQQARQAVEESVDETANLIPI